MKKKHKVYIIVLFFIMTLFLFFWSVPSIRSHALMKLVTMVESTNVVGKDEGILVDFSSPSVGKSAGLNWFSQMVLFNKFDMPVDRLGYSSDGTLDVSIYYSFGDFQGSHSQIYDSKSPYNSAFYGAYLIRFDEDQTPVDLMKLIEAITRYDYRVLILCQLGLPIEEASYEATPMLIERDIYKFDSDNWVKVDAQIETRSVIHAPKSYQQHYLQFGKPLLQSLERDFPEITLYGRTYTKYFPEEGVYIIFYIQAATPELVDLTDEQLLSKSRIVKKR